MTRVKICGITNAEDAAFCDEAGADFLGFIFVRESPRFIEPERASRIETRAKRVGVFRDVPLEEIERIARIARLDLVQWHGSDEIAVSLPVIRAYRVSDALPEVTTAADWVLFDSGGGTGRVFDWKVLDGFRARKFFLAGGLTPENVSDAIERVHPDAVDVASGVESAPGVKDHAKVSAFFRKVRL
jgi:phosphoribosylanthranilate isomerase